MHQLKSQQLSQISGGRDAFLTVIKADIIGMLISWHSEITAQAVIHVCDTTVLVSGVRFFLQKTYSLEGWLHICIIFFSFGGI